MGVRNFEKKISFTIRNKSIYLYLSRQFHLKMSFTRIFKGGVKRSTQNVNSPQIMGLNDIVHPNLIYISISILKFGISNNGPSKSSVFQQIP